ncbi:MAG: right-handed parallel beta-helix repeat-containing protein [Acidimicrobiales bacterium]
MVGKARVALAIGAAMALMAAGLVAVRSLYHRYLGSDGSSFYLSADGSDGADGHSPGHAWQTLDRLQSALEDGRVPPGSRILFRRGDVFAGTLRLPPARRTPADAGPPTLGAFGDGPAPVLDAAEDLTSWEPTGADQWTAHCTTCDDIQPLLLVEGRLAPLARWPNPDDGDGYRYVTAQEGQGVVIDDGLAAASPTADWVGAELVIRSVPWVLDRLPVAAQDGNRLTLAQPASYPLYAGFGYFLQNHPAALDQPGEWVWDAANRSVTIRSTAEPGPGSVEAVAAPAVLDLAGSHRVAVADLALRGARTALAARDCTGLSLRDLAVADAATGVDLAGCVEAEITALSVANVADIGLDAHPCIDCSITGSSISGVALLAGMGGGGDGHYLGARIGGADLVFEGNTIDGTGYLGVDVRDRATVRGNTIRRFNQVKSDGGGIYVYRASDVVIADNLVADAPGTLAGTPLRTPGTHGIYVDDQSRRVTITGNTVLDVGSSGIYLHNAADVTVTGNTIVGPREEGILLGDDDLGDVVVSGLEVRDNTVVVDGHQAMAVSASTTANPPNPGFLSGLGDIDANRYCGVTGQPQFGVRQPGTVALGLLGDWQRLSGYDLTSACAPAPREPFTVTGEAGPERVGNSRFDRGIDGWFGWPEGELQASWDEGGGTDGSPGLHVAHGGGGPIVHVDTNIGPVTAGATYRVRFSSRGAAGASLRVYLRQADWPFAELAPATRVLLAPGGTGHELFFTAHRSDRSSLLIFELATPGDQAWLDDVSAVPVDGSATRLADAVTVETNPSAEVRTVTVTRDGIDATGVSYRAGQEVDLAPYGSLVLFS